MWQASAGDSGWDIFSLDYYIDSPIDTVFTKEAMRDYLRIFNFLWKVKRVEHSLANIAKNHMTSSHRFSKLKNLRMPLHRCHLLRYEMNHFLSNFFNYLMVEVIESAWKNFLDKLDKVKDMN